jgi:hypothetical protein
MVFFHETFYITHLSIISAFFTKSIRGCALNPPSKNGENWLRVKIVALRGYEVEHLKSFTQKFPGKLFYHAAHNNPKKNNRGGKYNFFS